MMVSYCSALYSATRRLCGTFWKIPQQRLPMRTSVWRSTERRNRFCLSDRQNGGKTEKTQVNDDIGCMVLD